MRYLLAVQELAMDLSSDWIDECLWKRDVGGIDRNREPLLRDGLILQQWPISIHRPPTPPRLHKYCVRRGGEPIRGIGVAWQTPL